MRQQRLRLLATDLLASVACFPSNIIEKNGRPKYALIEIDKAVPPPRLGPGTMARECPGASGGLD